MTSLQITPAKATLDGKEYVLMPATITRTQIGDDDHGGHLVLLHVDYMPGGSQGICGRPVSDIVDDGAGEPLRTDDGKRIKRVGNAFGMELILQMIRVAGVRNWEDLPGTTIYVLNHAGSWGADGIARFSLPYLNYLIFEDFRREYYPAT